MARILIATPFLDGCFDDLGKHELVVGAPGTDSAAQALICDPTQIVSRQTLAGMPHLRLIAVAGAGADGIDHVAAGERGVVVVTVGHALAETTADIAFGLIIAGCRLMSDAEASLRAGEWDGWAFTEQLGQDVHGATLGLVGYGTLRQAVPGRAGGFRMKVLHHTRHPTGQAGWTQALDEMLAASDIISLHVPLTDLTRGLIDRRRLALLKRTAVLVNTARGPIVDEAALVEALERDQLFAAALDVYEGEPVVSDRLLKAPRTVLLPHIGSATLRTRQAMLQAAASEVRFFFADAP